jgi:hypothetical protein
VQSGIAGSGPPHIQSSGEHSKKAVRWHAGIWQFEMNNESILSKAPKIRELLLVEASQALREALEPYRPPPTAPEAHLQTYHVLVDNVVALGLAGDGDELRTVIHLAPALSPVPEEGTGDSTASDGAAAASDELQTPAGVLATLAAITEMPAGPGYDAFVQLLHQRAQVRPSHAAPGGPQATGVPLWRSRVASCKSACGMQAARQALWLSQPCLDACSGHHHALNATTTV